MGDGHPLTFTVEKPIPTQAAPRLATVISINKCGRLPAKVEPITFTRSSKTVMLPPSAATEGGRSGSCGPKGVVIDFAHAYRGRHAAKGPKYRSNENETGPTLTDYAAIAYVVMTVTFYPALAWLFRHEGEQLQIENQLGTGAPSWRTLTPCVPMICGAGLNNGFLE